MTWGSKRRPAVLLTRKATRSSRQQWGSEPRQRRRRASSIFDEIQSSPARRLGLTQRRHVDEKHKHGLGPAEFYRVRCRNPNRILRNQATVPEDAIGLESISCTGAGLRSFYGGRRAELSQLPTLKPKTRDGEKGVFFSFLFSLFFFFFQSHLKII